VGVIGLGVMGAGLARNIQNKGFPVVGYDPDAARMAAFVEGAANGRAIAVDTLERLTDALEKPRRILIVVPAGSAVDSVIARLLSGLAKGDILIDGGNSHFADTDRRGEALASAGIPFVGAGLSGGEAGALHGPAIMPGGPREAWDALAPLLYAIAAKADDGEPSVEYMGVRGAGHYVKMVHNGIEYGEIQLIAEIYDLLRRGVGLSAREFALLFAEWNQRELRSYLIEITAKIFERIDDDTGRPLVDVILDEALQKGTGKWTSQSAFDIGAPVPTVSAAVEARILSALKAERVKASRVLAGPPTAYGGDGGRLIDAAREALYASKVALYAQGFALLRVGSDEYQYGIDPALVAKVWRAGCIIRSALLTDIRDAYRREPALVNLLLDHACGEAVASRQKAWRYVVQTAVGLGVPLPATSASLAYYDTYRAERLPANLIQAQRDFFGAHTYRRIDRQGAFHTDWTGVQPKQSTESTRATAPATRNE
jgi:6-phosphogluconate dehydrogenase